MRYVGPIRRSVVVPLAPGNSVEHPLAVVVVNRAGKLPAHPLEYCPHRHIGGVSRCLDDVGVRVLKQPVREERERLAAVTLATNVRSKADPDLEHAGTKRSGRRNEGLYPADRLAAEVDGQVEPA